uniref:2Fe-2S ferredoxin-type domain-containing protein n=1 Tax=Chromera velia CCMP2878 TaxID=1169474 RepID=A0A0G4FLV5_9ALVE|eukprot:Cvel_17684.t1-p1 / transcript=Cvel_17684.t1 / gene=Cvel_17684 / organism=Chromera_velia_CCMP2878 / gene_product=Adrenodoxin-like protein, mitochondrial, putative / transcript_product=Adrenodoxin-like protein, mitochondrial, putative / location=Cvel_scaffold1426:35076-37399(+) / protein_length=191 / sequence_SO=supercontig / SO=protein_coding / is_pseudo=false
MLRLGVARGAASCCAVTRSLLPLRGPRQQVAAVVRPCRSTFHPSSVHLQSRSISLSRPSLHIGEWDESAKKITLHFVEKGGEEKAVQAPIGANILEVCHREGLDVEGACEASLACSTCHLIVDKEEDFDRLGEVFELTEREEDMLDMAPGLTDTSRLCCQLIACEEMDGMVFRLPFATRNFYVDGHKPSPH